MIGLFAASPLERRLLPGGRMRGPTPWLIAIMLFVMTIVAAAGLALNGTARSLRAGVAHQASVEITDGRGVAEALAALGSSPGVHSVASVPEAEIRALAGRWLGEAALAPGSGIPLPALIDVDLVPGADVAAIERRLSEAAPNARLVLHRDRVAPMLGALSALGWSALALVLLIALATGAAVVLATRAALNANRQTIEVMHGVGATDDQVAHLFQRRIALDALLGGVAGTVAALALLALLTAGGLGGVAELAAGPILSVGDLAWLLALPLVAALLATLVARVTVLGALREQL